jgi:enamine deaminase RidA (YjgF/YER057c/UK114 family)
VRQTFRNLQTVAEAAGGSLHDAVRIGVYLKDLADFAVLNEVSKEFLSEPYPARTTIRVGLSGFDIEIDAIVALPADRD